MRRFIAGCTSLAVALMPAGQALAYTSKQKAAAISVVSSGVTPTQSLTTGVVLQNTGEPGTASTLTFGAGGNTYRDSGRAIRVDVNTNLAANRILFYTDNLAGTAVPQCSLDTELGNDCGGLIGVVDKSQVVPLLWAVEDANPDFNFGASPSDAIGNEVFITDRAHVTTYVDAVLPLATAAEKQKLDTLALKRCDDLTTGVPNADNAGTFTDPQRYPQFFGAPGVANSDLCYASATPITIDPNGAVVGDEITLNLNDKVNFSEELSKNIAVIAFNCLGLVCTAPNLATVAPDDTKTVTSPFYLPIAADFRTAPGQDYASSTITVELVTQ